MQTLTNIHPGLRAIEDAPTSGDRIIPTTDLDRALLAHIISLEINAQGEIPITAAVPGAKYDSEKVATGHFSIHLPPTEVDGVFRGSFSWKLDNEQNIPVYLQSWREIPAVFWAEDRGSAGVAVTWCLTPGPEFLLPGEQSNWFPHLPVLELR